MTNQERLIHDECGLITSLQVEPGPVAGSHTVTFRSRSAGIDITRTGTTIENACGYILRDIHAPQKH